MKLQHPNSKAIIDVAPDHARPYLSQGWVEATPPEPDTENVEKETRKPKPGAGEPKENNNGEQR